MSAAPLIIALVAAGMFLALLLILAFHDVPASNKDAMVQLAGVLGGAFGTAIGYFLGSSSSSREKDATISSLTK